MNPEDAHGPPCDSKGVILKRQSTYWDVRLDPDPGAGGSQWRFRFKGKKEFNFITARFNGIKMTGSHPLLQDYSENLKRLYISSAPGDAEEVLRSLAALISAHTGGWRKLARYLNSEADPKAILTGGYGMLLSGPSSLLERAVGQLNKFGVRANILPLSRPPVVVRALILGESFVIAERIEAHKVQEERSVQPALAGDGLHPPASGHS